MEYTIKRRTLVKGAAWAAPVVVAASAVPAYAASQCDSNTVGTSSYSGLKGSANGVKIPLIAGGKEVNSYSIAIKSGSYAYTQPDNQTEVRNATFTTGGFQGATSGGKVANANPKKASAYTLDGASDVGVSLVLTQARTEPTKPSSQTVTFTFTKPVYSFSMPIYDLTYVQGSTSSYAYRTYRDVVTFDVNVTMSGYTTDLNSTSGTTFYRTNFMPTDGVTDNALVATYSSLTPITSFSVTYTDNLTTLYGWQGVGFGPITTSCP